MTDLTFDPAALRALLDAATPAPWEPGHFWVAAGLMFDDDFNKVSKGATKCACCNLGEPVKSERMNINGRMMPAHLHRNPEPHDPEHLVSGPDGTVVVGNYDYEAGGILGAEDLALVIALRNQGAALLDALAAAREELAEVYEIAQKADRDGFGNVLTSDLYRAVTPPIAAAAPQADEPCDSMNAHVPHDRCPGARSAFTDEFPADDVAAVPGDGEQAATTCGHQHARLLRQPGDRPILCTLLAGHYGDHGEPETGSHWDRDSFYGNVATGDPKPVVTLLCSDKAGFHDEHYYRAEPGDGLSHCPGVQPTSGQAS